MKLDEYRESGNVVDRRGRGRALSIGGLGVGGTLVVAVIAMLLGVDPRALLSDAPVPQDDAPPSVQNDDSRRFVARVLASTEDVWTQVLRSSGGYRQPRLVLFTDSVDSACGMAGAAVGPFYCPGDQQVYLDLGFYRDLSQRFNAPGDFAEAYVIAHEVGHHVQNLIGVFEQTEAARGRAGTPQANAISVRTELQADCFAGIWAHHAGRDYHLLEQGDIEEGLNAASAIGDDKLQRETHGTVVPDSFTHGTSAQRVRWFKKGVETGDPKACDTFETNEL